MSAPLQADENPSSEADSALGDDFSAYTESLRSSLVETVQENGRRYASYRGGERIYYMPDDDDEQDRSDLQHAMFAKTFDGKLFWAPLDEDGLHEVLDLGTGTGIWAIEMADQYPQANLLGIDLAPNMPNYVPPNAKFELEDFENDWTFQQKFDLVFARALAGGCSDWKRLMRQAYDALQPGGWMEIQDIYVPFLSDDGSTKGTAIEYWGEKQVEASSKIGRDLRYSAQYKDWLPELGFQHVEEKIFKWPIGRWPKSKKLKQIGDMCMINTLDGLAGFTMRFWTQILGMSRDEVEVTLAHMREDLSKYREIHAYWRIHVVYGQKPKATEEEREG